jgi:branched-chain amino acid transport system substrate-binding protein
MNFRIHGFSRWVLLVLAASVGVLLLAGSGSPNASHPAAALAGPPIKIYTRGPFARPLSPFPDVKLGVTAAVQAINKRGGINGRPLEVTLCDNSAGLSVSVACSQDAISGGAIAEVGSVSCVDTLAQLRAAQVACLGGQGSGVDFQDPIQFPVTGSAIISYLAMPFALKAAGVKRIGIYSNNSPNVLKIPVVVKAAARAAKIPVAGIVVEPITPVPDYSPYAVKMKSLNVDGTVNVILGPADAATQNASRSIGFNPPHASAAATTSNNDIAALGGLYDNGIFVHSLPPPGSRLMSQYDREMDAVGAPRNGPERRAFGEESYLDVYAFAAVAKSIKGQITAPKFLRALRKWPKTKPINLLNVVRWVPSAKGPAFYPRVGTGTVYFWKVVDNKIVLARPTRFDVWKAMGVKLLK